MCPGGGSNCSIRVRTAFVGVPRGEGGGSSSSSRVRVNPGGFELFDTSLNWHRTSASEGMGGEVRVRVRGREDFCFGRGGVEFEFEFEGSCSQLPSKFGHCLVKQAASNHTAWMFFFRSARSDDMQTIRSVVAWRNQT